MALIDNGRRQMDSVDITTEYAALGIQNDTASDKCDQDAIYLKTPLHSPLHLHDTTLSYVRHCEAYKYSTKKKHERNTDINGIDLTSKKLYVYCVLELYVKMFRTLH